MSTRRNLLKWAASAALVPTAGMLAACGGDPKITGQEPFTDSNQAGQPVMPDVLGYTLAVGLLKGLDSGSYKYANPGWSQVQISGAQPMAVSTEGTGTPLAYTGSGSQNFLFTGGYPGGSTYATSQAQVWGLSSNGVTVSNVGAMSTARIDHAAAALTDGKVLIAGGRNASMTPLASMEVYDPAAQTFSLLAASMTQPRALLAAQTLVSQNAVQVLLLGGGSADLYNVGTGVVSTLGSNPGWNAPIGAPLALSLGRDQALLVGCTNTATQEGDAAWWFNGTALQTTQNTCSAPRCYATATLLPNGKVLVAGGVGVFGNATATTDLYDPLTNAFTPGPSMSTARCRHMAAPLPDGTVLIAGGDNYRGDVYASAEIYDPASNSFKPAPSMPAPRNGGFMFALQSK